MTGSPESSDTRPSLLIRIRDARDDESWRAFVEIYAPLVYRFARRKGLQDADAADVAQEVIAEVSRCIRSFEYQPERGRFRDWLGTVTRRKLSRFFEKLARDAVPAEADESHVIVDSAWTDEFNARVLQVAMENARPHFETETWTAFERVWIEGEPASKVAIALGRSVDWVYVAKSRILSRLEAEVLSLAEDLPLIMKSAST